MWNLFFFRPTLRHNKYPKKWSHKKIIFCIIVAKVITNNFGLMFFSVNRKEHGKKGHFMKVVGKLPASPRYRVRHALPYFYVKLFKKGKSCFIAVLLREDLCKSLVSRYPEQFLTCVSCLVYSFYQKYHFQWFKYYSV